MEDLELSEEYLENVLGGANINVVADKLGVSVEELQKLISRYPHNMREVSEQLGSKIEEEKKRSREELEKAVSKIDVNSGEIYKLLTPPMKKNDDDLLKDHDSEKEDSILGLSYIEPNRSRQLSEYDKKLQELIKNFPEDFQIPNDSIDYSSISLGSNEKDGFVSTRKLIESTEKIDFHKPEPIRRRAGKVDRTINTIQDLFKKPVEEIVLIDDSKDDILGVKEGHSHRL